MATNFVQPGENIDWTNDGETTVTSGSVVVVGQQIGVALVDIAADAVGTVAMSGVFELPKVSGAQIAQGEDVTWDASAGAFDDNLAVAGEGDVYGCCVAWETRGAGTTTVRVKLNVGIATVGGASSP